MIVMCDVQQLRYEMTAAKHWERTLPVIPKVLNYLKSAT